MLKRLFLIAVAFFLLQTTFVFAGVEWQAKSVTKGKGKEATILIHGYAQNGNVREEFVEVKGENRLTEKGMYWLYKGEGNTMYVVNPKEKTYMAISIDSLMQFGSEATQFMKLTISNPKVEVKQLNPETLSTYECKHMMINSAYDMEMKVVIMKTKSHVEQAQEIWAADVKAFQDMASAFKMKSFKTGMKDLDELIQKQMEPYKNLGFTIKSITTQKNTQGKKTEITTTEMTVSDIATKNVNDDLFKIPADYKQIEFGFKPPGNK
jgi:hypothetical protein